MNYFHLLDTIRSITARRGHDRFPVLQPPVLAFRAADGGVAPIVVADAHLAKGVLQSSRYRQVNFLEHVLTIARSERTTWIRRFCDIGLIMVDGPEHRRRRLLMQQALDRCAAGVRTIPEGEIVAAIEGGLAADPCTSVAIAYRLVVLLFSRSIAALTGHPVELPAGDLFGIDFFNPFPTLSSLARCNESIDRCCRAIGLESLEEPEQAAVLSLLLMGVSPLHALLTAMLDAYAVARRDGFAADEAARRTEAVDSYAIVPTNFLMRACVAADSIGAEAVAPGDVIYLFLGSATGCPFSRLTSVPFGAGRHFCSGATLTQVMQAAVRVGLGRIEADWSRIESAAVVQGKAAAFVSFTTNS